ncbi:MAG: flavodoxin [Lachnospiraceae bacterium]
MKMKKILCVISTLVLVLGLVTGCSSNNSKNNASTGSVRETTAAATQSTEKETTTEASKESDATTEASSENASAETTQDGTSGKTLVVYYSASGSTGRVAETIADTLGADLFEITPVEPYSSDDLNWTNDNSRVTREHNDESLRDIELTQIVPENWDSYDTVLIGYPIWWAIAAWPVDNFVKGNDFTGKTVIPFCTSASSGLGNSGNLLAEMAGTGDWQEGHRFSSGVSASDVEKWVSSLNLGE